MRPSRSAAGPSVWWLGLGLAAWLGSASGLPLPMDDPTRPATEPPLPLQADSDLLDAQAVLLRADPGVLEPAAAASAGTARDARALRAAAQAAARSAQRAARAASGSLPDGADSEREPPDDARSPSAQRSGVARPSVNPLDIVLAPLDDADEAELRLAGQAALASARGALSWLRPAVDGVRSLADFGDALEPLEAALVPASLSGEPGGGLSLYATPGSAGSPETRAGAVNADGPGERSARQADQWADRDVLRQLIRTVRTALDHPMTWFVLALLVIAALAVSAAKRWLK